MFSDFIYIYFILCIPGIYYYGVGQSHFAKAELFENIITTIVISALTYVEFSGLFPTAIA